MKKWIYRQLCASILVVDCYLNHLQLPWITFLLNSFGGGLSIIFEIDNSFGAPNNVTCQYNTKLKSTLII